RIVFPPQPIGQQHHAAISRQGGQGGCHIPHAGNQGQIDGQGNQGPHRGDIGPVFGPVRNLVPDRKVVVDPQTETSQQDQGNNIQGLPIDLVVEQGRPDQVHKGNDRQ